VDGRRADETADEAIDQNAQRLGALLLRAGDRIAVAESLTAGNIQSSIASVSGASRYFLGGMTAYHLEAKVRLLGVDRAEAERSDCVSAEVARQMARGVRTAFGAEVGIGTTGYADGVAVPYAFAAVVAGDAEIVERVDGPGLTRWEMQRRVSARALELVISVLEARHGR
jgi:nicotinamide-nucleotide amidase